jgi:hypothetical protein
VLKLNLGVGCVGCADVLIERGKDRCQTIGQPHHIGDPVRDRSAEAAIVLLDLLPTTAAFECVRSLH